MKEVKPKISKSYLISLMKAKAQITLAQEMRLKNKIKKLKQVNEKLEKENKRLFTESYNFLWQLRQVTEERDKAEKECTRLKNQ